MVTETIAVVGMTCGGCEQRVHDAVMALPGVVAVTAEHIGDEVEVTFDPARLSEGDPRSDRRRRLSPIAVTDATMGTRGSRYGLPLQISNQNGDLS